MIQIISVGLVGLLTAATTISSILSLTFLLECLAALTTEQVPEQQPSEPVEQRIAVLVPAHNEAIGIKPTLDALLSQLGNCDRLIVIADNCTDTTAAVAREAGATVIERQDNARRGKGYALDFGLNYLEADPPDVVVLVDADCLVEPGTIQQIVTRAIATGNPVQSAYIMENPNQDTLKGAIATFAIRVKNVVRQKGLNRLGAPCLLTGSGMAFPWPVIRSVDLASGYIVEDMKLGLDLALAGYPPQFCASATTTGYFPQQEQATQKQRTRWEHGHLQTILAYTPKLLLAALRQKRWDLFVQMLDLSVPPLALFVMLWTGLFSLALLAAIAGLSWLPALVATTAGMFLLSAILLTWYCFGRDILTMRDFLAIPLYILWKIPLYFKFLVNPEKSWVRTQRENETLPGQ
jgi:cellulose synthase/poly-beta-1,6-N-acetylglucosamine synthase-like glycosyltransferase